MLSSRTLLKYISLPIAVREMFLIARGSSILEITSRDLIGKKNTMDCSMNINENAPWV
jgi:hypothetical protein